MIIKAKIAVNDICKLPFSLAIGLGYYLEMARADFFEAQTAHDPESLAQ